MSFQPPVSSSAGTVDAAAERSVEIDLQARREEIALSISRYLAGFCLALSIVQVGVWFLAPAYPQLLIYGGLILLLALGAGFYPVLQRRNRATTGFWLVYSPSLAVVFLSPLLIPRLQCCAPAAGWWGYLLWRIWWMSSW